MDAPELNEQQEQNNADFMEGFNSVRASDDMPSPEVKSVVEELPEEKPEPVEEKEPEAKEESEAEEPMFFGMSESQIKSLLERSARVDSIEEQLRKAHGKIGELNSTLQNMQHRPTQQQAAPVEPAGETEGDDHWAREFPEVVAIAEAKARKIAAELISQQQAQGQPVTIDKDEILRDTNIAILDATYEGWRDKISSQDFTLWIATQPQDVQETFNTTISAKVVGGVIGQYDAWKAKTQDRGQKSQRRLEQALVPTGATAKVPHAPTPHDEFVAGFNAIRAQY